MKNNWHFYERGGALFATLYPHFKAMARPPGNKNYRLVPRFWAAFRGNHLYLAYGLQELFRLGRSWTRTAVKEGVNSDFFKAESKFYKETRNYAMSVMAKPLPSSPQDLAITYRKLTDFTCRHTLVLNFWLDSFDEVFQDIFAAAVKDFPAIATLSQPAYRSVVAEYNLALARLALNKKPVTAAKLEHLYEGYYWLPLGWAGTGPRTKAGIKRDLAKFKRMDRAALRRRIKELSSYDVQISHDRNKICKKYGIPLAKVKPYFDILDYAAMLHDRRKEIQMRCMFLLQKIRARTAAKWHVPVALTHWLTPLEAEKFILTGKLPRNAIKQRKIAFSMMINNYKLTETAGKKAVAIINRLTLVKRKNVTRVTGTPASPGHARGKAVVTADPTAAIKQMKRGNILVTSMTTPDFVPAMRKAAAIVTDEGGITSHAAIISRELGIPCVIGTKIATKVFKTGDTIEVDADKGVVNKL